MALPVELPARASAPSRRRRRTRNTWREEALTRARELSGQLSWMREGAGRPELVASIEGHIEDARAAAAARGGASFERALGNLDAAEADLLRMSPDSYLRGYVPSLRAN